MLLKSDWTTQLWKLTKQVVQENHSFLWAIMKLSALQLLHQLEIMCPNLSAKQKLQNYGNSIALVRNWIFPGHAWTPLWQAAIGLWLESVAIKNLWQKFARIMHWGKFNGHVKLQNVQYFQHYLEGVSQFARLILFFRVPLKCWICDQHVPASSQPLVLMVAKHICNLWQVAGHLHLGSNARGVKKHTVSDFLQGGSGQIAHVLRRCVSRHYFVYCLFLEFWCKRLWSLEQTKHWRCFRICLARGFGEDLGKCDPQQLDNETVQVFAQTQGPVGQTSVADYYIHVYDKNKHFLGPHFWEIPIFHQRFVKPVCVVDSYDSLTLFCTEYTKFVAYTTSVSFQSDV